MGIRTDTPINLVVGAGALTVGGTDVGATIGGSRFRVDREYLTPELDGALAPVAGTVRLTRETATLEVTLAEATLANLAAALPGASLASNASSEVLLAAVSNCIRESKHADVVLTVPRCLASGTANLTITLFNALPDAGIEIGFTDDEVASYTVTFRAYTDPATPTDPVWQIVRNLS